MPLTRFTCRRDGAERPVEYCLKDCPARCHPLPVLAALYNDRASGPGVYHVTEILNPPQQVYMMRHLDYSVEPEQNAYTALGQAYHLLMERGAERLLDFGVEDTAILEQSFRTKIVTPEGEATLAGTYDRYEPDTKTLWDYKTEKVYSVKKMLAGELDGIKHVYQLNIYRVYARPEAEHLKISAFCKDHGYRDKVAGLQAIHSDIELPILDPGFVRELVIAKVTALLRYEKHPEELPLCEEEDLWGGKRCREYCPVLSYCLQGQSVVAQMEKGSGAKWQSRRRKST